MNPVEIEQAVSRLFEQPFGAESFSFDFVCAYKTPDATIRKAAPVSISGVLRRLKIHIKVDKLGDVEQALQEVRASEITRCYKARFLLAADGEELRANLYKSLDGMPEDLR